MEHPQYKLTYKDLPEIPFVKRWNDLSTTDEQVITNKLLAKQSINDDEKNKLKECIDFYKNVIPKLKDFDLKALGKSEIQEFLEYYLYIFTYLIAQSNDLYIYRLFRLVDNESILGKPDRIREGKYLSYPPLEIVQRNKKFNRANTPDFNVFYGSFSIDNVLLETKPEVGRFVTIGQWIPVAGDQVKVISYPICPNPMKYKVNYDAHAAYYAYERQSTKVDPLLFDWMGVMFNFINDEFAKPVTHHLEYLYSALFSKRVFEIENEPNPDYNFECIIYPSVGNKLDAQNIALKPFVIDTKFKLWKVYEFEITSTHYDRVPKLKDPEEISAVEYKDFVCTDWVERDGYIVW